MAPTRINPLGGTVALLLLATFDAIFQTLRLIEVAYASQQPDIACPGGECGWIGWSKGLFPNRQSSLIQEGSLLRLAPGFLKDSKVVQGLRCIRMLRTTLHSQRQGLLE